MSLYANNIAFRNNKLSNISTDTIPKNENIDDNAVDIINQKVEQKVNSDKKQNLKTGLLISSLAALAAGGVYFATKGKLNPQGMKKAVTENTSKVKGAINSAGEKISETAGKVNDALKEKYKKITDKIPNKEELKKEAEDISNKVKQRAALLKEGKNVENLDNEIKTKKESFIAKIKANSDAIEDVTESVLDIITDIFIFAY